MSCFFFVVTALVSDRVSGDILIFLFFFVDNMEKECYVMDRKDVSTRKG